MSVYQKFVESASSPGAECARFRSSGSKSGTCLAQAQRASRLPIVDPAITSTPISKQQYKRLVEADHLASCRHKEKEEQGWRRRQQPANLDPTSTSRLSQKQQCKQTNAWPLDCFFKTDDPTLLKWLQAMRFETELECLTSLQARTLAIDEHSAGALSVRNSQVSIQEVRGESSYILDFIDHLIEALPLERQHISRFSLEFSELWTRLMSQTAARTSNTQLTTNSTTLSAHNRNNLTIINCTPRKSYANIRALRPLDKLAVQIRTLCFDFVNLLYQYQETGASGAQIDSGHLESVLRKLKELYGKFVEILIRAECANIVRALRYDFSQASLNRLSSCSSLQPARPFESSSSQLPLKWALIALWQLTRDDSYICRTLTERWQTCEPDCPSPPRAAKRLDYSTKYEPAARDEASAAASGKDSRSGRNNNAKNKPADLESEYQKLYDICRPREGLPNDENSESHSRGALSSALKSRQEPKMREVSTIEILIDIIISQPNKHERLDMMNLIHLKAQNDRLVDLDELDQSVSAAIYTSNQYKVAALRILNHLCTNEQAVKTILLCFATPPPNKGQPIPENKIIRSIFECYQGQSKQEHIYQNESMFCAGSNQRGRKRSRQVQQLEEEEFSDYGTNSRQTNSIRTLSSSTHDELDEGDDVVVKEAIRLLVQLTSSFYRSNQGLDFYTLIGRISVESLVKYMTNIIKSTTNREMLFLSLTALANISFITTEPMKHYGTTRIMLEMFRASKVRSKDLELRDQAVTILANTAEKNVLEIVSNGGLVFLLSCLESCPTKMANYKQLMDRLRRADPLALIDNSSLRLRLENKPRDRKPVNFSQEFPDVLDCACDEQPSMAHSIYESASSLLEPTANSLCLSRLSSADLAAMERIHQKTAVAFARMSVDPSTTKMVLKYGGIKQMIDMCKFAQKRNHSDTVLIACIAALRKMAKVIESETFRYYNALDLIELELNQALEIYGTAREQDALR